MCASGIAPPAQSRVDSYGPAMEQASFDALCDRIRLGADGAPQAMLGHLVGNDLTSEQFAALLAIPGFQYLTESTDDSL
jgi:hypothetical protein